MSEAGRHPVVVFDLDGTLLRGSTVTVLLAEWLGRADEIAELERAFAAGEISNARVADASAVWLAGCNTAEVREVLARGPWIAGMAEALAAIAAAGAQLLLATITWRLAAEMVGERYGFAAVSGTEIRAPEGVVAGSVSRYFDEHDKLRFVEDWCAEHGFSMRDVAAVGDSRSDVPLFGEVGVSIALNATPDARAAATHAVDTDDLRDILPLLTR